jgi:hypothetical protein
VKRCPRCHMIPALKLYGHFWGCPVCKHMWKEDPHPIKPKPGEHHELERLKSLERRRERKDHEL